MRPIVTTIAIALLSAPTVAGAQEASYAPDHSGLMSIDYRPVMCVVPPCPPGRYYIQGDGFSVRARHLIVEEADSVTQYTGTYLDFESFIGGIWVAEKSGLDIHGDPLAEDTIAIRVARHNPGGR